MLRATAFTILTLLAFGTASAQTAPTGIDFEVASVKPSAPPSGGPFRIGSDGGPGTGDPTRMVYRNMSLSNLVSFAYDLKHYQLLAPSWLDNERFDIQAKVPEGATKEQVRQMLQNLLAERFKLVVHHESKEMQAFQLVVGKNGHKLKPAAEEAATAADARVAPPPGLPDANGFPTLPPGSRPMTIMMNGRARTRGPKTMEELAAWLSIQISRPVADATGLKGKYAVDLYWSSQGMGLGGAPPPPPPPGAVALPPSVTEGDPGPNIYSAVQEQLGLRLESKKGPVAVLVVDRIEKVPTEN